MTTLITGATGLLGRHIAQRLLDRGEGPLRAFQRGFDTALADRGVEVITGSLTRAQDVRAAVRGVRRVIHVAGRVERDPVSAHALYDLHVEGTRHLLDALRDQPVERIVIASTSGVNAVSQTPDQVADEHTPDAELLIERWPYYLSKLYAERVCRRFTADGLPITLLRPSLLLGPGDARGSSTGDIQLFLQRKILATPAGGLSFVDVRDAADAFIAALHHPAPRPVYMLGSHNMTVAELFRRLEAISGVSRPRLPLPPRGQVSSIKLLDQALRLVGKRAEVNPISVEMAQHFWYLDASLARRDLAFTPRPADDTLRDTIDWLRVFDGSAA